MPYPVLTVAEMREIEREADADGLTYAEMMQSAGRAAAEDIWERIAHVWRDGDSENETPRKTHALVLCGPGNNGGDGLVCAARLRELAAEHDVAFQITIYLMKPRDANDALMQPLHASNVRVFVAEGDADGRALRHALRDADVIVDALLGTGTSRPLEGALKDVLNEVRRSRQIWSLVIALDGVTGMNFDTGALDPAALEADATITFHAPKRGHFCFPAAGACGELVVADIGIEDQRLKIQDQRLKIEDSRFDDNPQSPIFNPQSSISSLQTSVFLADEELVHSLLPHRKLDANKGTHGRVLIVGGSDDYVGAPALAANAAYRTGAGLVSLDVPNENRLACAVLCPEATYYREGQFLYPDGSLDNARAMLIGPSMGQDDIARNRLINAVDGAGSLKLNAVILDADALNLIAPITDPPFRIPDSPLPTPNSPFVFTPHPGEMARLANMTVADVQADRIGSAQKFARLWGVVLVLKGAHTVIASPDGQAIVLPFANPALASAGTGDVLAGAIAGFAAQGLSAFQAALCGAYIHAAAGEQWRENHGSAGLLASDLLPIIPDVIQEIKIRD